jgi:L-threonylcarbamoyladenylate synthase
LRGGGDAARPDAIVLPDDPAEYGRALYATLHALDDAGVAFIAVESPPDDEAWLAVADRLRRAAAK